MKKECSKCHEWRKFSDFSATRAECKACLAARSLARYHERLKDKRVCAACGVEKELSAFHISHLTCKPCRAERRLRRAREYAGLSGDEKLKPIDLVPCTRCNLRGHEPGDPDKCLQSSKLYQRGAGGAGLGGQWW
jgi:Zn ribbon nucleic-acid-binding protein